MELLGVALPPAQIKPLDPLLGDAKANPQSELQKQ